MYAIIKVGGKQYNVEKGDILDIERQNEEEGKNITLDKVLLVSKGKNVQIGQPFVSGANVSAAIVKNLRGRKVISYKYRRRKSSHWTKGHRQLLTRIKINEIELG
ncbi:MAG: 50S ribosomal protein L21 [Candidatus Omnitrophota bacterium]